MALTVTEVLTDPPHFSPLTNCYFHNSAVCCLAGGVYRWLRWEGQRALAGDEDLTDSQSRIFGTVDQGLNWTLLAELELPFKTQWDGLFSPNGTRLVTLMRDKGDYAYDAEFSGLAYSDDGGLTWTSAVSQALFESIITPGILAFDTSAMVKLPGTTTVLAFGRYDVPGGPYNVLRSTDNGETFTPLAAVGPFGFLVTYAAALTATTIVAMDTSNGYYSTDAGATWTVATEPSFASLFEPVSMGGGVVLAVGRNASSAGAIFRSTDSGQTYTQLAALPNSSMVGSGRIQILSPTRVVAGGRDNSTPSGFVTWWLSEDTGATWTEASLSGTRVALSTSSSITITNTGIVLTDMDDPLNGTREASIWRGVVDGFVTTTGTCEAVAEPPEPPEPEPEGAVLGMHLICVPILSPAPCPPLCPADPVQPVGVLVLPAASVIAGDGWIDPLGVLELADVSEFVPVLTVPLGYPAGCGGTFANNYCAVAGV